MIVDLTQVFNRSVVQYSPCYATPLLSTHSSLVIIFQGTGVAFMLKLPLFSNPPSHSNVANNHLILAGLPSPLHKRLHSHIILFLAAFHFDVCVQLSVSQPAIPITSTMIKRCHWLTNLMQRQSGPKKQWTKKWQLYMIALTSTIMAATFFMKLSMVFNDRIIAFTGFPTIYL